MVAREKSDLRSWLRRPLPERDTNQTEIFRQYRGASPKSPEVARHRTASRSRARRSLPTPFGLAWTPLSQGTRATSAYVKGGPYFAGEVVAVIRRYACLADPLQEHERQARGAG